MSFFKLGNERAEEEFLPITEKPSVKRQLSYYVANLQGLGARAGQEDSFTVANAFDVTAVREQGLLFAVCDGMGGMRDGRLASETAVRSLRQSFLQMDRGSDMASQLKACVFQASAQVEAVIGGDGGSTVVTGILYQEKLYYASVGDSYLYLLRKGKLLRLNTEHNIRHRRYLEALREGDMEPSAPGSDPEEALTGFLGMVGLTEIDCSVRPLPLEEGDILLACSDGVGGVLSGQEVTLCLQENSVEEMCAALEARILSYGRYNQDNYTAIVVKCVL